MSLTVNLPLLKEAIGHLHSEGWDREADNVEAMAEWYTLIIGLNPEKAPGPIPMLLWCPNCNTRHVDAGEFATKPHHTHACQHCGMVWRPAVVATVGVQFLPGFRDDIVPPPRP